MPLRVKCPACGARTVADRSYAGRRGPCRECGKTLVVPQPSWGCGGWVMLTVVLVLLLAIPIVFMLIIDQANRAESRRRHAEVCGSHLERLHRALLAYHEDHGAFPPAYSKDEDGKPLHSWRVLLLPYLGEHEKRLHRSIDLDLPWNHPNNRSRFHRETPLVYRCPASPRSRQVIYYAVTGPDAVFSSTARVSREDIEDPPSQTVLLIEAPRRYADWMQPVDIDGSTFRFTDSPRGTLHHQTGHGDGVHVLMADGSVRHLKNNVRLETLRKLYNRRDGDIVFEDF